MAAGRFREPVTFERLVAGDDGYGNPNSAWADIETAPGVVMMLWADMLEGLGKEAIASGRLESPRTATIRFRQSDDVLAIREADRIKARGATWDIRGIGAVGRKGAVVEMTCEEVTS